MFCREQTVQLHRAIDDIRDAGGELYVIGNGQPHFIAGFRDTTGYDGALFTDPKKRTYRLLDFARGWRATFNRRAVGRALQTLSNGFRQGRTQGDPWQQGGAIVVAPDGEVHAFHRSRYAGDHVDIGSLIAAVKRASITGAGKSLN